MSIFFKKGTEQNEISLAGYVIAGIFALIFVWAMTFICDPSKEYAHIAARLEESKKMQRDHPAAFVRQGQGRDQLDFNGDLVKGKVVESVTSFDHGYGCATEIKFTFMDDEKARYFRAGMNCRTR